MNKFNHSGDLGDILACLPIVRHMGGGSFNLCSRPWTKQMTPERYETIRSLLVTCPYITEVTYDDNPKNITHDFSTFRAEFHNGRTLIDKQANWVKIDPKSVDLSPWIHVDNPITSNRIVVCRSPRYHGPFFPWDWVINLKYQRLLYLGIKPDYDYFAQSYRVMPKARGIPYLDFQETPNAMEAARIIKGCSLFISNQTFLFWLALAIGTPKVIQESYNDDSTIEKPGYKYVRERKDMTLEDVQKL